MPQNPKSQSHISIMTNHIVNSLIIDTIFYLMMNKFHKLLEDQENKFNVLDNILLTVMVSQLFNT